MKTKIILIIMFCVLAGCGSSEDVNSRNVDPKEANNENFKAALTQYYSDNCILISPFGIFDNKKFPITFELSPVESRTREADEKWNADKTATFDLLVDIGLLAVEDGSTEARNAAGKVTRMKPTKTYSLAAAGQDRIDKLSGERAGFCVGNQQVNEVVSFTEPSQSFGVILSTVNYITTPVDVPDWVNNDSFLSNFNGLKEDLKIDEKRSTDLVLLNTGWVHHKAYKD